MNPRALRREQRKIRTATDMVESALLPQPLAELQTRAVLALARLEQGIRDELGAGPTAAERRENV